MGGKPGDVASSPRCMITTKVVEVGTNAAAWWVLQWLQLLAE